MAVYVPDGMQKQLRLDALDVRRVEKQLKEMPEQCFFDGRGRSGRSACSIRLAWQSEDIADDGLGLLVDTKDVAHYAAGCKRRVAGKHVVIEILHEQTCRSMVVPMEAPLP